jgi:hypothetical protein
MKKLPIKVPHPHIEEKHVKHTAAIGIITGTALESAHIFYPAGLILLMIAGCIAVYEPYLIHSVEELNVDEH